MGSFAVDRIGEELAVSAGVDVFSPRFHQRSSLFK